ARHTVSVATIRLAAGTARLASRSARLVVVSGAGAVVVRLAGVAVAVPVARAGVCRAAWRRRIGRRDVALAAARRQRQSARQQRAGVSHKYVHGGASWKLPAGMPVSVDTG